MKKSLLIMMLFAYALLFLFATSLPVNSAPTYAGTIGTAGSFEDLPSEVQEHLPITFTLTGLTTDADFILVFASGSGIDNITFTTSNNGKVTFTRTPDKPTSGTLTIDLYGYNSTSGVASGSVVDSVSVVITDSDNWSIDILTDYIELFIVGGLIVGIVVMFRKKVL